MHSEVFLDTSFAIALSAPSDRLHDRALHLAKMLQAAETRLVTTQAVMLEIGNALSQQPYRQAAIILLNSLVADSKVEIVPSPKNSMNVLLSYIANEQRKNGDLSIAYLLL